MGLRDSRNNTRTTTIGPGFFGLLAIAFIVLKLTGHITWSWWWVLSPIWIPWSIMLFFVGLWTIWMVLSGK